jgi:predicted thioesterase
MIRAAVRLSSKHQSRAFSATVGSKGTVTTIVDESNTALSMGSGDLLVFATPSMVALMEEAACKAIEAEREPGNTSVGTMISTTHLVSCHSFHATFLRLFR